MRIYLNNGRLVKELVGMRDPSNLTLGPNKTLFDRCVTHLSKTAPEPQLNFSILCTKTHTLSCIADGIFSEVFA